MPGWVYVHGRVLSFGIETGQLFGHHHRCLQVAQLVHQADLTGLHAGPHPPSGNVFHLVLCHLAPLCHAFEAGLERVPAVEPTVASVAEGLAIAEPVRGRRLLQAVRDTNGTCVAVEEDAILQAQRRLARQGFYVEPTSATAVAALERVVEVAGADETIVVPLTGSGLKGAPAANRGHG